MKANFKMSLWQRIKAASLIWWGIVVTGELDCVDDSDESIQKQMMEDRKLSTKSEVHKSCT